MPCWPPGTLDLSHTLLFANIDDWIDDEGRPVGEIRASDVVRRANRAQYALCTYAGSRARNPRLMNVSALNQALTHWRGVRAVIAFAREAAGLKPGQGAPLIELARIAAFVQILPAYIGFANPALAALPATHAAAHKIAAGLLGLVKNRLVTIGLSGGDIWQAHEDARALHRFAENSGALLSRTGVEACGGPADKIAEALRVLTGEDRKITHDTIDLPSKIPFAKYADSVLGINLWLGAFIAECTIAKTIISSMIPRALPAVQALAALPLITITNYGVGCIALLRHLHPNIDSLARWDRQWKGGVNLNIDQATAFEVFFELCLLARQPFKFLPSEVAVDRQMLSRWCAFRPSEIE